jgi:hypothetical protein
VEENSSQRLKYARQAKWALLAWAAVAVAMLVLFYLHWLYEGEIGRGEFSRYSAGLHQADRLYNRVLGKSVLIQLALVGFAVVRSLQSRRTGLSVLSVAFLGATGFGGFFALLSQALGGAWGRPLRVRGRQLHPELRLGSDWTQGDRPDPRSLDEPTRAALEALWLHDAQKEHASVPAFSRLSWLLAAVGAPAELMEWSHRAAMEEIAHTRLCFALAAGYGRRSFTVEPMPELLLGGLDLKGKPLEIMAIESVTDGCQLEDFNADVAAACALVCEEPVTRRVLEQIAREERSHAEFSWAMLEWLLGREPRGVRSAIEIALAKLQEYPRPTAVSGDKQALVAKADVAALRRHGRLPDTEWAAAWDARLGQTRARLAMLLAEPLRAAA